MKPTTDGRWAHLACAIWIPGFSLHILSSIIYLFISITVYYDLIIYLFFFRNLLI